MQCWGVVSSSHRGLNDFLARFLNTFSLNFRDLSLILDRYEKGKPFFLYTGRGPSSGSLHLGHLIPFIFTKYLQDAFNVPLIIQVCLFRKESAWFNCLCLDDRWWKVLVEGFDSRKGRRNVQRKYEGYCFSWFWSRQDIYIHKHELYVVCKSFFDSNNHWSDCVFSKPFYQNVLRVWNSVTNNQARAIFGFVGEDSMGKAAFPAIQAAPCFSSSFPHIFNNKKDIPCLIPAAIDQVST